MRREWCLLVGSGAYQWGVVPISGEWGVGPISGDRGLLVGSGAY